MANGTDSNQPQSDASEKPTPVPLMQIITGFWASKTLAAAVELDLFTRISGRGATIEEATSLLGIPARPAEMLLSACAALGLLEKQGERYVNSPLSDEFLVRGKPYYFGGFVTMLDRRLYLPWNRLSEALRHNQPQTWGEHANLFDAMAANPDEQRVFTEAMHSLSAQTGKALAESFDFSAHGALLDLGGGSGAYCIEAAQHYPHLHAMVLDIAPALEIAQEKIDQAGVGNRVKVQEGDFFKDDLPQGFDVILLSMILHDWSEENDRLILRKCFHALPPGGAILISELMMNDDKAGPVPAALMSLNMLIEAEGRNYTWAEYETWLKETGFQQIRRVPLKAPGANGLVIAYKPTAA